MAWLLPAITNLCLQDDSLGVRGGRGLHEASPEFGRTLHLRGGPECSWQFSPNSNTVEPPGNRKRQLLKIVVTLPHWISKDGGGNLVGTEVLGAVREDVRETVL